MQKAAELRPVAGSSREICFQRTESFLGRSSTSFPGVSDDGVGALPRFEGTPDPHLPGPLQRLKAQLENRKPQASHSHPMAGKALEKPQQCQDHA